MLPLLDRFLTIWILLAMIVGVVIGALSPSSVDFVVSQSRDGTNLMVAIGLIVMMFPPFTAVNYSQCLHLLYGTREKSHFKKVFVMSMFFNWIIGPILMFIFALLTLFDRPEYLRGTILIGLARCIAMVIIWNQLALGSSELATVLVGVNSIFQIIFFSFYATFFVGFLPNALGLHGTDVQVSIATIAESVGIYLGIPFVLGFSLRFILKCVISEDTLQKKVLPIIGKFTLLALLYTIIIMFILKGKTIVEIPLDALRIAVPLLLYFIVMFGLNLFLGFKLKWPYRETVTVSFTSASNNFELALAVAIGVFGLHSGEAFAAVIGPLVEVPVMLLLVHVALHYQKVWPAEEDTTSITLEETKETEKVLLQNVCDSDESKDVTLRNYPIVFVCVANSCRSQIAEGFFNTLASNQKKIYRAQSGGTKASGQVNHQAIAAMKEVDIDISHHTSKSITPAEMKNYKYVISMGCGDKDACPRNTKGCVSRDWGIEDPAGQSMEVFRRVREEIRHCVQELMTELETGIASSCCVR